MDRRELIDEARRVVTAHGFAPCWLERFEGCSGRIELMHLVKRRRIEQHAITLGLDDDLRDLMLWDVRNLKPGCERHHRRFDGQAMPPLRIFYAELPRETIEFAREWGIVWSLERDFPASDAMAYV